MMNNASAQIKNSLWLETLLRKNASTLLLNVLNHPDSFRYQMVYTKIDRDKKNRPKFTHYYLNVDKERYFYPASMVKLPTVLVSLEKMNALKAKGINKYSTMLTDSAYSGQTSVQSDSSSSNGMPSLNHYMKKIFLVSDNDAYNRLYEFCGQQYLNEMLWQKGYSNMRITRRFEKMTEEENRHTNPIRFLNNGQLLYSQPATDGQAVFNFSKSILIGNAHWDANDNAIPLPYDFSRHNKATLEELQQLLQSVLFPTSVSSQKRFHLTKDDYKNLYQYLSEKPSESKCPQYDSREFFDSYTKFFFFRDGKQEIPNYLRSFNKTGWSHGFLTDVAYIVDFKNNTEFMLSGSIYVNSDGVLNDDRYEYESIGYPFFKEVGKIIYEYELKRKRNVRPNLKKWKLNYD